MVYPNPAPKLGFKFFSLGTWSARKARCPESQRPTADSLDSIDPLEAQVLDSLLLDNIKHIKQFACYEHYTISN